MGKKMQPLILKNFKNRERKQNKEIMQYIQRKELQGEKQK